MFLAEGIKVVEELLESPFDLHHLYATEAYMNTFEVEDLTRITEKELKLISDFSNPNQVIGVFHVPEPMDIEKKGLTVVLDGINDPGNLGTIIRLCDWFAVSQLICSEHTVDCFNQKVVQASMGSLARVSINYVKLEDYLSGETRMVYGTFLGGNNVYDLDLDENAVIVLGNEANGISLEVAKLIKRKLTIPQFGPDQRTESLNVATATAIFLSEFRR